MVKKKIAVCVSVCVCICVRSRVIIFIFLPDQLSDFLEDPGSHIFQIKSQQPASISRLQTSASCLCIISLNKKK